MGRDEDVSVRVALRIRPMLSHETSIGCQPCISEVPGEPQVVAGGKDFTFDYVFGSETGQSPIFDNSVTPLIEKFFAGYNCTILAYGQTGAGKTHTMGTADTAPATDHANSGVIPRIIHELFGRISDATDIRFRLKATYLEIIKEEVKDLLTGSIGQNTIRENHDGSIVVHGLKEQPISSVDDLYTCLRTGAENRAVAGHALNAQSSRSHAVFTLTMEQQRSDGSGSESFLLSKFNLVDLAGSERAKRTRAEGERLKEGININKGLLALGNVISALGDPDRKTGYVPYRDSKITRLLQDSLGGNSLTLMIACCSPADSNLEETLNTLRYADRARKIKNKAVVNRDPRVAELMRLRHELAEMKANQVTEGSGLDMAELQRLRCENDSLKNEKEALISQLRGYEQGSTEKLTRLAEMLTVAQIERDKLREILSELQESGVTTKDVSMEEDGETSISEESETSVEEAVTADTRRRELGEELQILSERLNSREQFAKSLQQNDETFALLREQYQNNMASLTSQIEELTKSKTDLEWKIKSLEKGTGNKKEIQKSTESLTKLLAHIAELKAKCKENEKLLKIKKGNDEELQKLTVEIKEMKKTRVDLLKDMRAQNKKFQAFKSAKNKEVAQMKRYEERKRAELHKQAAAQQRNANVMKRRYEEVQMINKRLKETLDKQQKTLGKRVGPGKSLDVKALLKGHIEVNLTTEIAREAITMFIEQRKKLKSGLEALKKLPNSASVTEDIADMEHQIKFKSQQISSLQTEIVKYDQAGNKNAIFKQLSNVGDCKTGIRWLCSAIVDSELRERALKRELEEEENTKTLMEQELAAVELNFEEFKKTTDQRELDLRSEFQMSIRSLEVQNKRLKTLRTKQPVAVKAGEALRRRLIRTASISFTSDSEGGEGEEEEDVGEDWYSENKDIFQELDNMGLKTPHSVKKALKRRTTRDGDNLKRACGCKGSCSTKVCGCVKLEDLCGATCRCLPEKCRNRRLRKSERDEDNEENVKKPRLVELSEEGESGSDMELTFSEGDSSRKKLLF